MIEKFTNDKRKMLWLYVALCMICGVVGCITPWGVVGVILFSVAIGKTKAELKRLE